MAAIASVIYNKIGRTMCKKVFLGTRQIHQKFVGQLGCDREINKGVCDFFNVSDL